MNNDSTLRCIILERQKTKHFDDSDADDQSSEFRDLEIKFEEQCRPTVLESYNENKALLVSKSNLASTTSSDNKFVCELCKKAVKTIHSLRRHMKIHTGEKPHKCKLCEKSFVEPGNLTKHLRKHTKDKKHQCNECGLRFYERNKLAIHIRTHTGEKPYSCPVCTRPFATTAQVQIHMKVCCFLSCVLNANWF